MSVRRQLHASFGELVCAAGVFASGAFLVIYGLRYPVMTEEGVVGPGAMPLASGIALAAVGAMLLIRTIRTDANTSQPDSERAEDGEAPGKPQTVAGILAVLVLTVALAPYFGLVPMLSLAVFVFVFVFERESFFSAASLALGGGFLSWLLFDRVFGVPLPMGSVWALFGG